MMLTHIIDRSDVSKQRAAAVGNARKRGTLMTIYCGPMSILYCLQYRSLRLAHRSQPQGTGLAVEQSEGSSVRKGVQYAVRWVVERNFTQPQFETI